jgi:hypothetical protein
MYALWLILTRPASWVRVGVHTLNRLWIRISSLRSSFRTRVSWSVCELPKATLGPVMPFHSTPCRRPPLKRPFQGWPPSARQSRGCFTTPLDTPPNPCLHPPDPFIPLQLMTALVDVALNLNVQLDNTCRQYEAERQKVQWADGKWEKTWISFV